MTRICAWCGKTMGETNGGGKGITHGICKSCMDALFAGIDGDADAAPVPSGAQPVFERYVSGAEWPEPRSPEYVPDYIVRRERDEEREREMMAADGYDWKTEPVSAHTQAAQV